MNWYKQANQGAYSVPPIQIASYSFDGTLVTLREEAIEPADNRVSNNHIGDITDDPVDFLSRTFGFKKQTFGCSGYGFNFPADCTGNFKLSAGADCA